MLETRYSKISLFTMIFFAVTGTAMIFFVTSRWGVGLSPDSASYLAGARNIINGRGISLIYDSNGNPLITWVPWVDNETYHLFPWPPFFPLVLSIFGFMKLNLLEAGRWLNAVLFGANIFLIILIVKKYLKSFFLLVFAPIILITSNDMIRVHSMLWSEPLFIFLSLLGFVFLIDFLENKKILFLLIASLFFSLAFFTRTIGISLIAVSAVAVLFYSGLKIKNKIIYCAISILIGLLPFSIWTLKNRLTYGSSPAEFNFHHLTLSSYSHVLDTISLWVMTYKTSLKIRIILISVLIIIIISIASFIAFKNKKRCMGEDYKLNSKITGIFLFFILFYFLVLLCSAYFFDAAIGIGDYRLLIPVPISMFIVFLFFLKRFLDFYSSKEGIKIIAFIFCGFLIATSLSNSSIIGLHKNGQWYSSKNWYQSETIKELKIIQQAKIPIYTNEPGAVYLFMDRSSVYLPIKRNINTGSVNSNYQKDLNKIMEEIKEKDGLLVFFDSGWYSFFPDENEVKNNFQLLLVKDTSDGAIYRIKK
jgi:hypothetical protein